MTTMSQLPNVLVRPDLPPPLDYQRFVLLHVPWQNYLTISDALPDWPNLRITYDRGGLQFMTLSPEHERAKYCLGRLLETLAEEFGMQLAPYGSMTFRRADLERALEPDQCYWIAHEAQMRGMRHWDPATHPPPDLVIEVEISRSVLDRIGIYAALGVPEIWRYDGEALRVEILQSDRTYQPVEHSPTFPSVPLEEFVRFLQPQEGVSYLDIIRSFREWVRQLPKE